jgi:uncharacterized protein (DUF305 family)
MRSPSSFPRRLRAMLVAAVLAGLAAATVAAPPKTSQAAFAAENDAAMAKMMSGMDIKPSGDIDQDFATMMIAHHQGAIDMALAELRYGSNEQLHRIAQEIIVDQQQEIAAMHLALGRPLPPSVAAPTHASMPQPAASAAHLHSRQHDLD